jgi:hypothetical protein
LNPSHVRFILQSDGAGAYAGFGLMSRLGYMGLKVGVRAVSHHTGESGGGKCAVDQNFGMSKNKVGTRVTLGQGKFDVNDAVSLARALNYKPIKKTVNYAVTFVRKNVKEPTVNKSARDGKLQSHSTRTYYYDDDGFPTEIKIEEQSFLPTAGQQKMISMKGVWPEGLQQPVNEIIPSVLKLDVQPEDEMNPEKTPEVTTATTTYVSKVEKDEQLQSRKNEIELKSRRAEFEKEQIEKEWQNRAKAFAAECGVSHILHAIHQDAYDSTYVN